MPADRNTDVRGNIERHLYLARPSAFRPSTARALGRITEVVAAAQLGADRRAGIFG
jgi:hypothetical protein